MANALCSAVISTPRPILRRADNSADNSAAELAEQDPNTGEHGSASMNGRERQRTLSTAFVNRRSAVRVCPSAQIIWGAPRLRSLVHGVHGSIKIVERRWRATARHDKVEVNEVP